MKPELHKKPLIPQGWLRAIVFCIFYFSLLIVLQYLLMKLLQPATPAEKSSPQGIVYILFIANAILSAAVVWLFRKFIDRQSFESLGFAIDKNGIHAGTGFFLGIFLMCAGSCILYFSKNLQWTDISFNGSDLFISLGLMLIVAVYEELVFRGYILGNLLHSLNKWLALIVSSLVFALAHVVNPDFSVVAAINILLAGLLLGLNYMYTKNLWFGILLHFTWNFFQGPILGYDVSGMPMQSLLHHEIQGSELLTGGKFGFEGSMVASALLIAAVLALAFVYEKKYAPQILVVNN